MKNLTNSNMNTRTKSDEFSQLWERCKHWQENGNTPMPDDAEWLRMADFARQQPVNAETNTVMLNTKKRGRWIPYAAAASLLIGVTLIEVSRHDRTDPKPPLAKEVNIDGQTVKFMCNNDCSAQEVLIAANDIFNE